jgi:hypothetical protein
MATLTSAPVPVQMPPLTTPQILWRALWAIWILDIIFLVALLTGGRIHRAGMQTVGKDTAPSIIAAQHIKAALADMDANAANELLGESGQMSEAVKNYEARRQEAAEALIRAAGNIIHEDKKQDPTPEDKERRPTLEDKERESILRLQVGLGTYESRIQRARDLHGEHNADFVGAYNAAARLMDEELLPAADELDTANLEVLEQTYEAQKGRSLASRGFIMAMAVVALAVLVFVQNFLARRTRRLINVPLFLATGITLGCAYYALHLLTMEQYNLKVAREDAFASIHALWRARAVAYAANADESRYLLDKANAAKHEQGFFMKRDSLVKPPQGETLESLVHATRLDLDGFTGYLTDELKNLTFPGERDAAIETLRTFGEYLKADDTIRKLERSGHHQEAIAFCTGTQRGESNWSFAQFDNALGETLDINQKAFDKAVASGFAALAHFDVEMSICTVMIGVLILLGLMQRIREYR